VILLLIGINGISANSPALLNTLVSNILRSAPDVHLVVAQITPYSTYNQTLWDYNVYIKNTLVPAYAADGFNVTTVDLYSMFLTNPADPTSIAQGVLSNNINHPTNALYDQMAQAWFDALMDISGLFDQAAPRVDAGVDMVAWSGKAVQLAPQVVEKEGSDWTQLSYKWRAEPADGAEFTQGSPNELAPSVTITKTTENPSAVTMTFLVGSSGKMSVFDSMTIEVYDDACKASIAVEESEHNPADINGDCAVDLYDCALLAASWLSDVSLSEPFSK